MSTDLDEAKQKLLKKLGPSYNVYIRLLGKWFRGFLSKEEFDKSAKQLIKQNFVSEHNQFWLAFFHHCASNTNGQMQANNFHQYSDMTYGIRRGCDAHLGTATSMGQSNCERSISTKVRCLPNKIMTHMKIFVIVWEMGLDSINDQVSIYIHLALKHFLKNIITELICTKTAYRLRENRFKYAIGVKPMNPYLNNSLKIYTTNLEYDPYQIESNRMNSSLLDTCVYNDTLFPSRLYEAQALYEFACSTTSVSETISKRSRKRPRLSEIFLNEGEYVGSSEDSNMAVGDEVREVKLRKVANDSEVSPESEQISDARGQTREISLRDRKVSLYHLMIALQTNRTIIPSQSLYSINLERIFTKYSS